MKKDETLICRCEEVTRGEILEAIAAGCHSVSAVKRYTRAGMGACQGRTCGRLIRGVLVEQGVLPPDTMDTDKPRFPIVPCAVRDL